MQKETVFFLSAKIYVAKNETIDFDFSQSRQDSSQ